MVDRKWHHDALTHDDLDFFRKLIEESKQWQEEELGSLSPEEYYKKYEEMEGEWRVWSLGEDPVAVTYHLKNSPSNDKPWLGTILTSSLYRRRGFSREIIAALGGELKENGSDVLFAGVPPDRLEWLDFLARVGFEQYMLEKDGAAKHYMVLVSPLPIQR